MTGWLLDTNVLSELRRLNPNPNVVRFVASKPLEHLFVSIVTYAEIRFGIENLADVAHRAALNDWLTHKVRPMFEERTLPSPRMSCLHGGSWSRAGARPNTSARKRI